MNEDVTNSRVRYERTDIRLGCLLAVLAVAVCVVAATGYGVWRFFWREARIQQSVKQSPYPLAPALSTKLPPEPRLEQLDRMAKVETTEVAERLAAKEEALNSYGPAAEKNMVHIPIQQAIKAIAGTLPVRERSPGQTTKGNGLVDGGEPNSGRMFRGEP